jgi:hypothetical protein
MVLPFFPSINRKVAEKLLDYQLQRMYEYAVEKMEERGFDPSVVRKGKDGIEFDVEPEEETGMDVDFIKADSTEEYMEKYIDATIDKPKYQYDDDLMIDDPETGEEKDMWGALYPGTKVNINAIEEWVRNVKVLNDPMLQDVINTEMFDSYVDSTVYKVARKLYYVGRKPRSTTPEEWDSLTRHMRPAEGTYSSGDVWDEFPYGADYEYRGGIQG